MATARIEDWGFAVPAEPSGPERSPDSRWRFVYVRGLARPIQLTTLVLDEDCRILVLYACGGEAVDAVAAAFPERIAVVIREDAPGRARATCDAVDRHEHAATAVAIVKASGAWDESNPIAIEIGDRRLDVRVEHHDGHWSAVIDTR